MPKIGWQDNSDHPMLVDLNTGTTYEWVQGQGSGDPFGAVTEGYANSDDQDWVWTRDDLETESSLDIVEWRSLDERERERQRLGELYEESQPDSIEVAHSWRPTPE